MAFLLPFLAPAAAQLTAGVVIGIANASQAENNVFSITIGNRVFTTGKPFPLQSLPFELREDILLHALALSRSLCPDPPPPFPPGHPFSDPRHPFYNSPLNPHHPLFVGPSGERELNGYPTSAWRWLRVSREWWAVLRAHLWRTLTLRGTYAYRGIARLLADPDSRAIKSFVRALTLKEGFDARAGLADVYPLLRAFPHLERLTYAPSPLAAHMHPFGIALIPADPGPHTLAFAVPFDTLTNPSSRTHLARLPRLHTLRISLRVLEMGMAAFLAGLPHLVTLEIVLSVLPVSSLNPFAESSTLATLAPEPSAPDDPPSAGGPDPHQEPAPPPPPTLTSLTISIINLSPSEQDALLRRVRGDNRLRRLVTLYHGTGASNAGSEGPAALFRPALGTALSDVAVDDRPGGFLVGDADQEIAEDTAGLLGGSHWERTTRLSMFGGLFGVRLESRR